LALLRCFPSPRTIVRRALTVNAFLVSSPVHNPFLSPLYLSCCEQPPFREQLFGKTSFSLKLSRTHGAFSPFCLDPFPVYSFVLKISFHLPRARGIPAFFLPKRKVSRDKHALRIGFFSRVYVCEGFLRSSTKMFSVPPCKLCASSRGFPPSNSRVPLHYDSVNLFLFRRVTISF